MIPTANDFQQIKPGLWVWCAYSPQVKCDLWTTAVATTEGLLVVDPVPLVKEALAIIITEAGPPRHVVLTNGNHERSAMILQDRFEALVLAHREAQPELDISLDRPLDDGDMIGPFEAIPLPGGAPGEIALRSHSTLIFGDSIVNLPDYGSLQILPAKYCSDQERLRTALDQLLSAVDIPLATFAHGEPLVENASKQLRSALAE